MKTLILMTCCLFILISCKTIDLNQVSKTNTTQQLVLGSIGNDKDFILQKEFNNNALPSFNDPIKISVSVLPFNKQTFKVFSKAKALQTTDININYIDSIPNEPKYLQLKIADKVAVIKALNNQENKEVKTYMSHQPDANILMHISIALSKKDLESITNADAVFLVEKGLKTYALQLYKNQNKTQLIQFNDGVVFEYKAANCCWQANKYHKLDIVDLVSKYNNCPNSTYRSAKRAENKIKVIKF